MNKKIFPFLLLAIAAVLLLEPLTRSVWGDEAWTLRFYADKGAGYSATTYNEPNNHVFYSVFMAWWTGLIGGIHAPEWLLRLPSFLFSLSSVAVVLFIAPRVLSRRLCYAWATLIAFSPFFFSYGCQLRGYAMSLAFITYCTVAAFFFLREKHTKAQLFFALLGALSVYTIPTNVIAVGALSGAILFSQTDPKRALRLVPTLAAPLLGFLGYLPMWDRFVELSSVTSDLSLLNVADRIYVQVSWIILGPALFLSVPLAVYALVKWRREKDLKARVAFMFLMVTFIFPALLIYLKQSPAYSRNFGVFLPLWSLSLLLAVPVLKLDEKRIGHFFLLIALSSVIWGGWREYALPKQPAGVVYDDANPRDFCASYLNFSNFTPEETLESARRLAQNRNIFFFAYNYDIQSLFYYLMSDPKFQKTQIIYYQSAPQVAYQISQNIARSRNVTAGPELYAQAYQRGMFDICFIAHSLEHAKKVAEFIRQPNAGGIDCGVELLEDTGFMKIYKASRKQPIRPD